MDFPAPLGPHDPEQALLADGEGDLVEEGLAALARLADGDLQVLDVQRHLTGVHELLERVADQAERRVADADDVAWPTGPRVTGWPLRKVPL
ncbi:hypothetical protein SANTM175S_08831 [Streptomyces antimycoticus]